MLVPCRVTGRSTFDTTFGAEEHSFLGFTAGCGAADGCDVPFQIVLLGFFFVFRVVWGGWFLFIWITWRILPYCKISRKITVLWNFVVSQSHQRFVGEIVIYKGMNLHFGWAFNTFFPRINLPSGLKLFNNFFVSDFMWFFSPPRTKSSRLKNDGTGKRSSPFEHGPFFLSTYVNFLRQVYRIPEAFCRSKQTLRIHTLS